MPRRVPIAGTLIAHDRYERCVPRVEGGVILALEEAAAAEAAYFVVPGLRNAHVHLDLTDLERVPRAVHGFARWIEEMLARRRPLAASSGAFARSAAAGAVQALAAGTTAVADIDSSGEAFAALAASGLKGISFREVLGRDPEPAARLVDEVVARAERAAPLEGRVRPGVTPHAPYSCSAELYRRMAARAAPGRLPRTTHAAETLEEAEFLRSGRGALRDLLDRLGAGPPFEQPPGKGAIAYLGDLGWLAEGVLLAHANHLEEGDEERLAAAGAVVVYCPRSHNFFGHSRHPVARLLDRGVAVALGTDSLASNSTLSLLDEMAFLAAARPDLGRADVLRMATSASAPLLDGGSGRLEPGEPADFAVVESLDEEAPSDLERALRLVTGGGVRVAATIVSGMVCHFDGEIVGGARSLTWEGSGLFSPVSSHGPSGAAGGASGV